MLAPGCCIAGSIPALTQANTIYSLIWRIDASVPGGRPCMSRYKLAVRPSPSQMLSFFQGKDQEPFVMVNLLVFKPLAEYPPDSREGRDGDKVSGEEAYRRWDP